MTSSLTRRQWLQGATTLMLFGAAPFLRANPMSRQEADAMAAQIAGMAGASSDDAGQAARPYELISPPVTADKRRVRFFFSYACPHCKQYYNGLSHWGRSLPPPLRYSATPLITNPADENQITALYGRLICSALAPEKVIGYDVAAFRLLLGRGESQLPNGFVTPPDVLKELVALGIPSQDIQRYASNEEHVNKMANAIASSIQVIERYSIVLTPSVAIMGKILATPDHAAGNPQQFVQLLNGLVSQVMA